MSTKDIRTHYAHTVCDVCGRTLLRGERAETYINGGARRSVCELCKSRAIHEGWIREGTVPAYGASEAGSERRRSILGRLRSRRDEVRSASPAVPTLDDELSGQAWAQPLTSAPDPTPAPDPAPAPDLPPATPSQPAPARAARPARPARPARQDRPDRVREPRHVRAVPTSDDQKILSAIEMFNESEHRRTVSGVSRSLGAPTVSIAPDGNRPSLMRIVVSWELCWYRYEVDLSDEVPSVRVDGQGYELDELTERERLPNAIADELGQLTLA